MKTLDTAYAGITAVVAGRNDRDLLLPSGCHGWTVCDLLFHLTLDARRALITFATPADGPPTADAVGYWRGVPDDPAGVVAHTQWVRRSAAAYDRPTGVAEMWAETAPAAVRAAAAADLDGRVATQGHVLTVPDFVATLVTEAVIHHLDLTVQLPDAPEPAATAVAVARSTLDGLAGGLPPDWTAREALLKGTGRAGLSDHDRRRLGERAALFPLLS